MGRVAGAAGVTQVEGQELRGGPQQPRGHVHQPVADGEVHQRAAREVEQRFGAGLALGARNAVEAVLVDGQVHVLREVGLDLGGGHRDAVQQQHEVDDVVVVGAHLPQHAQAVGGVAGLQLGVHGQRGLELGEVETFAQAHHLQAVAQHVQRAPVVKGFAQALQHHGFGTGAVQLGQLVPCVGLGGLQPRHEVGRVQRARGVVAAGIAVGAGFGIQPAVRAKVGADVAFELDFGVQGHGAWGFIDVFNNHDHACCHKENSLSLWERAGVRADSVS